MSAPETFHLFPELPPELRIAIWKEAFSGSTTWKILLVDEPAPNDEIEEPAANAPTPGTPRIRNTLVQCDGPELYKVGLACQEARQIMKEVCGEPVKGVRDDNRPKLRYWINFEYVSSRRMLPSLRQISVDKDLLRR